MRSMSCFYHVSIMLLCAFYDSKDTPMPLLVGAVLFKGLEASVAWA